MINLTVYPFKHSKPITKAKSQQFALLTNFFRAEWQPLQSNNFKGASQIYWKFVLMSFELSTFPCREVIKLVVQKLTNETYKINPFIYIKCLKLCNACSVYRYSKTSHLCFFSIMRVFFRNHFSAIFLQN